MAYQTPFFLRKEDRELKTVKKNLIKFILTLCLLMTGFTGCSLKPGNTGLGVQNSLGKDEIFRIGNAVCTSKEYMLYLTNIQNQYEKVYGKEIWDISTESGLLRENVKQSALAKISQVKAMSLLAKNQGVSLNDEQKAMVDRAATIYYNSLSEKEKEVLKVDKDMIKDMYREYMLASLVYEQIVSTVNPEISDDEARIITVEHIFIRTYSMDGDVRRDYSDAMKGNCLEKANNLKEKASEGANFRELARQNGDLEEIEESFGMGEVDETIEEVAFSLGKGEISPVFETKDGYHILKCISTFDQKQTDENKIKLVEVRRKEAFEKSYDEFVNSLSKDLNEDLLEEIELIDDPDIKTSNFFECIDNLQ